jgi:hypothetical protein
MGADRVHEEPRSVEADVARKFLAELMDQEQLRGLLHADCGLVASQQGRILRVVIVAHEKLAALH